jgi:hypothetical protein
VKVYVAGASSEIERAEVMIKRLRDAGIGITCTWPEVIRKVGAANPAEAGHSTRRMWASQDLFEVEQANVLLFLLPGAGHNTIGAWTELGCSYALAKKIVMAGKHPSIFTGLADEIHETDEQAYQALCVLSQLEP